MSDLNDQDREILHFESLWWKYAGAKETRVRELFGLSMTRYYQRLNWMIDQPEALQVNPMVVHRLRRLRDRRQQQRKRA